MFIRKYIISIICIHLSYIARVST